MLLRIVIFTNIGQISNFESAMPCGLTSTLYGLGT